MSAFATISDACKADPLAFPRLAWRRQYWSRQADVYRACKTSARVAAKGGHSTGKTFAVADFIIEHVAMNPGAKCIILGPKYEQVRNNLWAAVRKAHFDARFPLGGNMGVDTWTLGDDWWARIAGADKPESLHMGHGKAMLVVIDEAVGVEPWAWEPINSMLASDGARLVVMFNPTRAEHKTRQIADDPAFSVVTLNCEDHPNVVSGENVYPGAVTRAYVEDFKARVARGVATLDEYRARVQGEFPRASSDALVSGDDLAASLEAKAADVRRLALDVARFGEDRNALTLVDEHRRAKLLDTWGGMDLMQTTGRLVKAIKEHAVAPSFTFVDSCGVGGGVVDRARELGYAVRGVDAGEKATGRWASLVGRETRFANRRAEMYWALRCAIKSRALSVPKDYWSDLGMIRVGYASDSAIKLPSKDDMRNEHGRSPDRADSLALAFAAPSGGAWATSG